jgi:hypothetical protein
MTLVQRGLVGEWIGGVSGRFDGSKNQAVIDKQLYRRTDGIWEVFNSESQE